MNYFRKYGGPPFTVSVVHGGPGAAGEMAPVARELSQDHGILEPFQRADSVKGQILELKEILLEAVGLPVILVGYSWGAWLSLLFAAEYPELVKKLILVSSGPFEARYADSIEETRYDRFTEEERIELNSLAGVLHDPAIEDKNKILKQFGALISKADAYAAIKEEPENLEFRFDIYKSVWREAAELRRSGGLLKAAAQVRCPVTAIHGDHDPHPAAGVEEPLSRTLKDFQFILLEKCGHKPWIEQEARDEFYKRLRQELKAATGL
ncbi:MAG: alpha/beta hydrolase [bacterium]|nr:alpha/beta hydrolase [bacterium]